MLQFVSGRSKGTLTARNGRSHQIHYMSVACQIRKTTHPQSRNTRTVKAEIFCSNEPDSHCALLALLAASGPARDSFAYRRNQQREHQLMMPREHDSAPAPHRRPFHHVHAWPVMTHEIHVRGGKPID